MNILKLLRVPALWRAQQLHLHPCDVIGRQPRVADVQQAHSAELLYRCRQVVRHAAQRSPAVTPAYTRLPYTARCSVALFSADNSVEFLQRVARAGGRCGEAQPRDHKRRLAAPRRAASRAALRVAPRAVSRESVFDPVQVCSPAGTACPGGQRKRP
eukprot:366069-Chlamydomonas_euryale.AAC.14